MVYSTYLIRSGAGGIAVDALGNAYVTGGAGPGFFTTPGAFQTTFGGAPIFGDAFVCKLNAGGSALLYSTYLGGSSNDGSSGIAVDASGNAYVTGFTYPPTSPPPRAPSRQPSAAARMSSAMALSQAEAAGTALLYSTYLGGNRD